MLEWLATETRLAGLVRVVLGLAAVWIVWYLVATYLVESRLVLVPPMEVAQALLAETVAGRVWENGLATVGVLCAAFPVSVLIGVAIGMVLASNKLVALTAGPLLSAMNSVPVVALAPLLIAWLGLGFGSKFAIILLVSVFPILVTTEVGLRATDATYIEAARSFNATRWQLFTTVTLPFALRYIVSGIRVAWARALVGVVVGEFFGAFAGFGFAILAAGQTLNTAVLLAYVILLGFMGLLGSIALAALERRMAPWAQS